MIDFNDEKLPYFELSNFYKTKTPRTYDGMQYATSEHRYQALKFLGLGATPVNAAYAETVCRMQNRLRSARPQNDEKQEESEEKKSCAESSEKERRKSKTKTSKMPTKKRGKQRGKELNCRKRRKKK